MESTKRDLFGTVVTFPQAEKAIRLEVPKAVYAREAVMQTAYTYIDRYFLYLDDDDQAGMYTIFFKPQSGVLEEAAALAGTFLNDLLHQQLRCEIQQRTAKIKELIIGRALYGAEQPAHPAPSHTSGHSAPRPQPLEQEEEFDDLAELEKLLDEPIEDLEDIAVPWEEKYGKSR